MASAPRVFIYNISAVLEQFLASTCCTVSNATQVYDALLNDREFADERGIVAGVRRLRLGVRERMYADGFLHEHLASRAIIAQHPDEADLFWLPLWDYAACTVDVRV